MKFSILLLVGGLGTRLRPLSLQKPKPLMPLLGRPALERFLQVIPSECVAELILAVGYGASEFERWADATACGSYPISIVREEQPLGTGGAVAAAARTRTEPLLVVNGDTLVNLQLTALLEQHRALHSDATMLVTRVPDASRYGRVEFEENRTIRDFREKNLDAPETAGWINAGVYLLEPPLLQRLPEGSYSLEREIFPAWISEGVRFRAFQHEGYFLDIGTPEAYLKAHELAWKGQLGPAWEPPRRIDPTARVAQTARLVDPVWIGADCEIGPEAVIQNSVVGGGSKVDSGASVQDSVLWECVHVGARSHLRRCVLGRGVEIAADIQTEGRLQVAPPCLAQGELILYL